MRTELFRSMGGFDDSLRAAEDYDLWLRTMVEHEAELLDEPLVIRRGGHRDQLSTTTPAIDRFRILSLTKLLGCERLASERRAKTIEVLVEKCGIYSKGLRRRGRNEQAEFYEQIAAHAAHWDSSRAVEISRAVETMRSRLAETSETSESCLMKSWDHAYWLPDGIHND